MHIVFLSTATIIATAFGTNVASFLNNANPVVRMWINTNTQRLSVTHGYF
jgi:large-conductance mechanosensitive channel